MEEKWAEGRKENTTGREEEMSIEGRRMGKKKEKIYGKIKREERRRHRRERRPGERRNWGVGGWGGKLRKIDREMEGTLREGGIYGEREKSERFPLAPQFRDSDQQIVQKNT